MKKFLKSFVYAGRGICCAFTERNFRFHICAAAFVIFFAASFYELTRAEWAVLLLTTGLVPALEAVNTSIERLADKVSTQQDDNIRRCKDCAAGAVLIASFAAVAVGIVLLGDIERLQSIAHFYFSDIWRLFSLLLAVAAAVFLVLLPERLKK